MHQARGLPKVSMLELHQVGQDRCDRKRTLRMRTVHEDTSAPPGFFDKVACHVKMSLDPWEFLNVEDEVLEVLRHVFALVLVAAHIQDVRNATRFQPEAVVAQQSE